MNISAQLVRDLAERYHTPLYFFEEEVVRKQCRALRSAVTYPNSVIRYACKALTIGPILEIIKEEGLWIDAVSLNEVERALLAGFTVGQILYTGEGASRFAFEQLLNLGVLINCSSIDQLKLIGAIRPGSRCSIRFNPGEGHGHSSKVNTGGPASKHGVYLDQIDEVKRVLGSYDLKLIGVHAHIGSGTDLLHWLRINEIVYGIAEQFNGLEFIDLGGGLPVVYNSEEEQPMPLAQWGKALSEGFAKFCERYGRQLQLQIEPGRYIVAESGHLIAEVQTIKHTPQYAFVLVNSGLNHNPRPAMYGSYHPIEFVSGDKRTLTGKSRYVVAGYLCESGDLFTIDKEGIPSPREFPELQIGDLMVMANVGAYSHAMKSEYNSMNLPCSVLRNTAGEIRVIERRGTLDDILRREREAY